MPNVRRSRYAFAVSALALAIVLSGCGQGRDASRRSGAGGGSAGKVSLGYFPNITHAPAIVGAEKNLFRRHLGTTQLKTSIFNAGPAAVEAVFAGAIDATYIGPNPAINAFVKSKGEAIRIVSGATSGGASLVVQKDIRTGKDLKGKKVATPQLGNTQDVAARNWLKKQGLSTDVQGGGEVSIVPQENAQTLETFRSRQISGAWVPEPWVSRLVLEAAGKVLVDEASLWPGGRFVTSHLIVRTEFLRQHPAAVRRLLSAHVEAVDFINANSEQAKVLAGKSISELTGKKLPGNVLDSAWSKLEFTTDPVASSLRDSAKHAASLNLLESVDLNGIYDLAVLNELLKASGKPTEND